MKATDSLDFVDDRQSVTCRVTLSDLDYWLNVIEVPVVLVLYDAHKHRGFWLDVQEYIEQGREFAEDQDEAIIRIPVRNKLTIRAVDRFRDMSIERNHTSKQSHP